MRRIEKRRKESIISVGDRDFKIIVNSFLEAALFTGIDYETDEMLDVEYDIGDFDEQSKEKVRSIVREFLSSVEGKGLNPYTIVQKTRQKIDDIGIDLFMTMTGQGVGFWDGDWGEYGDTLTNIADQLKEVYWIEGAFPLGANGQIVLENHKNQNTITLPENVEIQLEDRTVILEKGDRVQVSKINEASEVSLDELPRTESDKALMIASVFTKGEIEQLFDGIHGYIVTIATVSNRITADQMKRLISLGVRWVEGTEVGFGEGSVSVGF